MRAVEFVRRADEEIATKRLHVDSTMGRELNGINEDECAGGFCLACDGGDVVDGAEDVAGVIDRDEFGAVGEEAIEQARTVFERIRIEVEPLHGEGQIFGDAEPKERRWRRDPCE